METRFIDGGEYVDRATYISARNENSQLREHIAGLEREVERLKKLERMLVDVHDMLDRALFVGYHTNEGAVRINWCHRETQKLKEARDE